MKFLRTIRLSRPRFWIYELGTYALGVCAGLSVGGNTSFVYIAIYGFFFLFPANLLIYGINDVFDYETDKLNPKKTGYEDLLEPSLHGVVYRNIFLSSVAFIVVGFFIPIYAFIALLFFYFFAFFYSAPPIRAKARPFFDSFFSAGHYVVTGVFGYYLTGASGSVALGVFAGMCWYST
jgi:4-hydroxybenzoate polyprenyltransferase